jgi:cysteine desulfuration protein SufE
MKWSELVSEFQELSPEERLEELVELAGRLPPLSAGRAQLPLPEACRIQECQTPVYLWVDVREGRLHLEAFVPPQSPTVRGLVTLIVTALQGAPVEEVFTLPGDPLGELGLTEALGMTRQQGFRGVVARIQREARIASAKEQNSR